MSRIKLGTIVTYEEENSPRFIIGDVVDGGGYSDPALVRSQRDLERRFRYAPRYKEYLSLVRAGASLTLAGNQENFNDIPTLVLFNLNAEGDVIPSCHPLEEDLYKGYTEIKEELEKYINEYNDERKPNLDDLSEYSSSTNYSYEFLITPNNSTNPLEFLKSTNIIPCITIPVYTNEVSGRLTGLIRIDIVTENVTYESGVYRDKTTGIQLKALDSLFDVNPSTGNVDTTVAHIEIPEKFYEGKGNEEINNYILEQIFTYQECILYNYTDSTTYTLQDLLSVYNSEDHDPIINYRNNQVSILFNTLIYYYNTYESYCPCYIYVPNIEFTQKVYYYRGLKNQGVVLSLASKIRNKEGRDIKITLTNFKYPTLSFTKSFLDESNNYTVSLDSDSIYYLPDLLSDDEDINIVTCNSSTNRGDSENEYQSILMNDAIEYYSYNLDSYATHNHDNTTLVRAYNSFLEYESAMTILLLPYEISGKISELNPLFNVFKKITNPLYQGGFNSTLFLPIFNKDDINTKEGITKGNLYLNQMATYFQNKSINNVYVFSGGYEFQSMFEYARKWITDRVFSPDNGSTTKEGEQLSYINNTLHREYNGYEITYTDSPSLRISLVISNVLSNVANLLYPGITITRARTLLQTEINTLISENPGLESIELNSIRQDKNTLYVYLTIIYYGIERTITINFKLYKNYGD